MLEELRKESQKAFAQDMVKFVNAFDDEFKAVFGPEATGIINSFVGLFQQAEGDLTTMWDDHWAGVIGLGLNAIGQMGGEVGNALKIVGNAFGQFQVLLDDVDGDLTKLWEQHWDKVVNIGLSALQQLAGGTNEVINTISSTISGAMQGYKIAGPWGAVAGGALEPEEECVPSGGFTPHTSHSSSLLWYNHYEHLPIAA